jgi:hypothetical protein
LIACAQNNNWYCHTSGSNAPDVAGNTTSHGAGNVCWCYSVGSWTYYGPYGFSNSNCPLSCPEWCGA